MKEEQWVQHKSGNGEKWKVVQDWGDGWNVRGNTGPVYYLPALEYHLCDPPEVWVDVTGETEYRGGNYLTVGLYLGGKILDHKTYRLRKVQQHHEYPKDPTWAFIVERKQP